MASSHLMRIAGPLIVPDLNTAQQVAPLDQAPLSPTRAALSPVRPASPAFHSVSLRPPPLSPTRLVPALALPSPATASRERLSAAAALDQPPALHSTPGEHILGGHPTDVISAVSAEGLASAHILITAVALLSSARDAAADPGVSQLHQGGSVQDSPLRESVGTNIALAVPEGSNTPGSAGGQQRIKAGPWWLAEEGGNPASPAAGEGAGASWWARQVEAARAEDSAREGLALQESLHSNKGPDAPYALEGADPLLGAASPSLGEQDNGGAWWSQLTKIPTADWLHLTLQQIPTTSGSNTPVEGNAGDSNTSGPEEEPRLDKHAERPAAAETDHKGFSTFSFENNGAAQIVSEGGVATSPVEHAGEAQPALDVPQGLALGVEPRNTEAVASTLGQGISALEWRALLESAPRQGHSTDGTIGGTECGVVLLTEVPPVGGVDTPTSSQVSEVTRESQSTLDVGSPLDGAAEAEPQPPVEVHAFDQVSVDPPLLPAAAPATPAPAHQSAAPLEVELGGAAGVTPERQAQAAVVRATPSEAAASLRGQRAAVDEARARLETIKAWRSSRAATPPRAVSVAPPPLVLPVLSGLPSPTLGSGIFPTRGSPVVATVAKPDGSIWMKLQQLEWATEETADTFGRSSIAVHLAERHDGKHA